MSLQKLISISLLAACAFAQTDRAIVTGTLVFEGNYSATIGAHLVASLKRYNQLPFSVLE